VLLDIRHVTQHQYDASVREAVMEVWMQPQKGARQRLVSFEMETDPPAQLFSYADAFGNAVYHFDVPQPHQRLTIQVRAAVETQPAAPLPAGLDMGEWDRLRSDFVRGENFDFLRPHGFAVETEALRAFVAEKQIEALRARDPLSAVRALNALIYEAFAYETGVTHAESPIDEALNARRGVCQDFAHIMITVCRAWGIPARYISGYLFNDRRAGDRSDPDSTHAWVEVFLPSTRWIGLDPTNNIEVGERHVAAAMGRDYGDVPPSRGVYKGDADGELAVAVSVRRARAAMTEPQFMRAGQIGARGAPRRRGPVGGLSPEQKQQQQQ
jgi:transglutaminase-like putative cysteine protease